MTQLDSLSRPIEYLRLSVTDRCNLRCLYCMPPEGVPWYPHEDILSYEEFAQVVRVAADLGIRKVRLTGGEPLVRRGIVDFIRSLKAIPGIEDLSMTTNATLLAPMARELAAAGLDRVNISLDSLESNRLAQMTRGGQLDRVLEGIAAAQAAGLEPVKVNVVVIRGRNEDEVVAFARKTVEKSWNVRYIEFMPVGRWQDGENGQWAQSFVSVEEIRNRIEAEMGPLEPVDGPAGAGPARYYRIPGTRGSIGFISAVSDHFCAHCNRLRLSADGRLRPCLLSDEEVDLRSLLRSGVGEEDLRRLIVQAIQQKPEGHRLKEGSFPKGRTMSEIGG